MIPVEMFCLISPILQLWPSLWPSLLPWESWFLRTLNIGGPGAKTTVPDSTPEHRTRSCMLQLRSHTWHWRFHVLQLRPGVAKLKKKKKRNCKLVKLERNPLPHTIMKLLSVYFSSLPRIRIIPFSSSTSVQRAYIGQVLWKAFDTWYHFHFANSLGIKSWY